MTLLVTSNFYIFEGLQKDIGHIVSQLAMIQLVTIVIFVGLSIF